MSLAASLSKFKSEVADATSRNLQHSRPASSAPARTSTPKPGSSENKRTHDSAFATATASSSQPNTGLPSTAGKEVLTQVWTAISYLKSKDFRPVAFDDIIGYLSLPNDAAKNIPLIKQALQKNERVEYLSRAGSGNGKESFKYRPTHPVTNAEELTAYLLRQPTAQGISVKDLKDGWPDCSASIDVLEKRGEILVMRNRKDGTPKMVWADSPTYHILNPNTQLPQKLDGDFVDFWSKTKLPASEAEIRSELEKSGLTPTSQVKEVRKTEGGKRKEKRRVNRKGGKTTNSHMLGILKQYDKR